MKASISERCSRSHPRDRNRIHKQWRRTSYEYQKPHSEDAVTIYEKLGFMALDLAFPCEPPRSGVLPTPRRSTTRDLPCVGPDPKTGSCLCSSCASRITCITHSSSISGFRVPLRYERYTRNISRNSSLFVRCSSVAIWGCLGRVRGKPPSSESGTNSGGVRGSRLGIVPGARGAKTEVLRNRCAATRACGRGIPLSGYPGC